MTIEYGKELGIIINADYNEDVIDPIRAQERALDTFGRGIVRVLDATLTTVPLNPTNGDQYYFDSNADAPYANTIQVWRTGITSGTQNTPVSPFWESYQSKAGGLIYSIALDTIYKVTAQFSLAPINGGGNPFDQDLNTYNSPRWYGVNTTREGYRIGYYNDGEGFYSGLRVEPSSSDPLPNDYFFGVGVIDGTAHDGLQIKMPEGIEGSDPSPFYFNGQSVKALLDGHASLCEKGILQIDGLKGILLNPLFGSPNTPAISNSDLGDNPIPGIVNLIDVQATIKSLKAEDITSSKIMKANKAFGIAIDSGSSIVGGIFDTGTLYCGISSNPVILPEAGTSIGTIAASIEIIGQKGVKDPFLGFQVSIGFYGVPFTLLSNDSISLSGGVPYEVSGTAANITMELYAYDINLGIQYWKEVARGYSQPTFMQLLGAPSDNAALGTALDSKQPNLSFDSMPIVDSNNPVTSNGIYQYVLNAIGQSRSFRGGYDPTGTGLYPTIGGTGGGGSIESGNIWEIKPAGTINGNVVTQGTAITALVDNPANNSDADWNINAGSLGFTPLNAANNLSDLTNVLTALTNLGLSPADAVTFLSVTATIFNGDLNGNASSSDYATAAGSATYATNAGTAVSAANATSAQGLNGQSLATLTTGLLKNTTTTGVPVIATPNVDYVTPDQLPIVSSGLVPTLTITNRNTFFVSSITGHSGFWSRVGNIVTFSFYVTVTRNSVSTGNFNVQFDVNCPVASAFSSADNANGICAGILSTNLSNILTIQAVTTGGGNKIDCFGFQAPPNTATSYKCTCQYVVE